MGKLEELSQEDLKLLYARTAVLSCGWISGTYADDLCYVESHFPETIRYAIEEVEAILEALVGQGEIVKGYLAMEFVVDPTKGNRYRYPTKEQDQSMRKQFQGEYGFNLDF